MEEQSHSDAPSTPSDFYNTGTPRELPERSVDMSVVAERSPAEAAPNGDGQSAHVDDVDAVDAGDGDSSSEMDVSVSSRSATPATGPQPKPTQADQEESPSHGGAKRKLSDASDSLDALTQALEEPNKKPRLSASPEPVTTDLSSPAQRCPAQIWQQVFLRLSPAMLSRCLRVSKAFNHYLTGLQAQPVTKKEAKKVRVLDSDAIWTEARKNYFPNMPRPLMRCSELRMLQLIGGKTCQFCKRLPTPAPATGPFNSGPGLDGLRVIWPFGIRACGQCWEQHSTKDVQLLVSPAAPLRFALPYAYRTPDLHFVPEMMRQLPGGIPSHLRVGKVYFNQDVQTILSEYEDAKGFGEGAAEEWRKGLSTKGKEAMADAARWEKWESQMRFGADLAHVLREYDLPSFPHYMDMQSRSAGVSTIQQPPLVANGTHILPQPVHVFHRGYGTPHQAPIQQTQPVQREARNAHQVKEARATRRADIERRCMELEPPLQPSVLDHMNSFQATMQITTPMNDAQWEMLKPRLLAQREAAEYAEHQKATQLAALQAAIPSVVPEDSFLRPAKEVYDQHYEQAQDPLRIRLGEYADEFIDVQWYGGQGLDRDSAPSFGIQVLMHVRKRYVQDKLTGSLPVNDRGNSGHAKTANAAPDPFLSLDNMKWVYDNKVRTFTDRHRRELFICAGCAEERKPKWFAFEGLIQHYGAKHTTAFSRGNIVVHWQTAEWPDEPPFHTDPSAFIKMDRKNPDHKAHGRARNTPQQHTGHNGPFMPPSPSVLLSENPLFSASPQQSPASNGYYSGSAPLQHYPSPYIQHQGQSFQPLPARPATDTSDDAKLLKLSSDAREMWDSLEGVHDLLECVRIQTVMHQVIVRFDQRFHRKPHLDLLTDALATNVLMRPIKNAHGLACRVCVGSQTDGSASYQSYYARISNVKLFNVSSLITHFKVVHQGETEHLDWSKDMIELPETQLISDLIRAPGMDDGKLALIAEAFPSAFLSPLPKVGVVTEPAQDVGPAGGLANRLFSKLGKKQPKSGRKKDQHVDGTPLRDLSLEPSFGPAEDEYDPTKPMYHQPQTADPARFDTDLARKTTASVPPTSSASFGLTPDTLAALSSLTALAGPQQPARPERVERSPSVGRAGPYGGKDVQGTNGASTAPPDIAAILASLTGHGQPAQTATPPATVDNRTGSAPRHAYAHPYTATHAAPAPYRPYSRNAGGRYQPEPEYRAPPGQDPTDLQAALARNSVQYDYNQQAHTYAHQAPQYGSSRQSRSPPRYQYVQDDGPQYIQAAQHAPAYHQAPVQYIQLPPQQGQPAPVQYHYERPPPPKPIYIDQYGREVELIPIDSAPATVQYVPHPYEQQQQQQQQYARPVHSAGGYPMSPQQGASTHQQYAHHGSEHPMYYGTGAQQVPGGQSAPAYVYDNGTRASVPRG